MFEQAIAKPQKILIVDDDPAILHALEQVLQDEGYAVETTTKDGRYVEESLGRGLPDLIILDMLLSGHDGRDICRLLKSRPDTTGIPIIMLSAHPKAEATSLAAGADEFLAKPFSVDDLLLKIEKLL